MKSVLEAANKRIKELEESLKIMTGADRDNVEMFKIVQSYEKKNLEIIKYCEPHIDQMWASVIVGLILDVEFRDAKSTLREKLK